MKKNTVSRFWSLLLALIMVLSLTACGSPAGKETNAPESGAPQNPTTANPTAAPATDAPTETATFDPREICEGVTITIAVAEDVEVPDWDNTHTTLSIEEALGVNIEFEVYSSADFLDKINVMINGGDELPDVIFRCSGSSLDESYLNWAEEGAIIPLNEYYADKNYSANFWAACEAIDTDLYTPMLDAERNVWAAPYFRNTPTNETPKKFWYNRVWAQQLGFEEIVTLDDYYELCKVFVKAGDMNGNGLADEVCMSGYAGSYSWFTCMMNSFVYATDDYYLDVEDGELRFAFTTDEWKEGLKYIKKFFDEGLFTTNILTQDKDTYNSQIKGELPVSLAHWDYYAAHVNSQDVHAQRQVRDMFSYIPALEGPTGLTQTKYEPIIPNVGAVITADCENPDAAFLVLDFLLSEEWGITGRYGQRGVHWDYFDEVQEELLPEGLLLEHLNAPMEGYEPYIICYDGNTYWGKNNPQTAGYMQAGPAITGMHIYFGNATSTYVEEGDEVNALRLKLVSKQYQSILDAHDDKYIPDETIVTLPMTAEESSEASEIYQVLKSYVEESIGAFLTGEWDIDSYWDTYMAELEKIGAEQALEIYQTAYDRTK